MMTMTARMTALTPHDVSQQRELVAGHPAACRDLYQFLRRPFWS
jgi:hypothetical protein